MSGLGTSSDNSPLTPETPLHGKRPLEEAWSPTRQKSKLEAQEGDIGSNIGSTRPMLSTPKQDELLQKEGMTDREKKEAAILAERARRDQEKVLRDQEKARKEAERLAEKARKEAEREAEKTRKEAERVAEKARKEAEREAERKRKELEKEQEKLRKEQEKEQEKLRKEQEKLRKEAEKEAEKEEKRKAKEAEKEAKRLAKEAELEAKKAKDDINQRKIGNFFVIKKAETTEQTKEPESDYKSYFLPYHVKTTVTISDPRPQVETPEDSLQWLQKQGGLTQRKTILTARQVCEQISNLHDEQAATTLLSGINIKHIQFAESLRPPYVGSGPEITIDQLDTLILDPLRRALPSLDYDYDSDAEWVQEDEDGEDLNDEDDSEEDDEDEDMDEFVSSDEDATGLRVPIVGHLTSSIRWNDGSEMFKNFAILSLIDGPIDPFKNYWAPPKKEVSSQVSASPLTSLDPSAVKSILSKIQGSQFNQTFLVELLKQDFPDIPKSTILLAVRTWAKREGGKESDKKWVVDPTISAQYGLETSV